MKNSFIKFIQNFLLFFLSLILIEIVLRAAGFGYNYVQRTQNKFENKNSNTKIILCIGESTTAWGMNESYPSQLQIRLDKIAGPQKFLVINEGAAASNSTAIVAELPDKIKKYKPDIIIAMMGINDVWALTDEIHWYSEFRLYKFYRLIKINFFNLLQSAPKPQVSSTPTPSVTIAAEPPTNSEYNVTAEKFIEHYNQKQFSLALEYLTKSKKIGKLTAWHNWTAGNLMLELGDKLEAQKYFNDFCKLSKNIESYKSVGNLFFLKYGPIDEVGKLITRNFLSQALALNPNDTQALKQLGVSYSHDSAYDTLALEYLNRAFALGIRDFDLIIAIAAIHTRNKNYSEAEKILIIGIEEGNDAIWLWTTLITNYIYTQDFEKAQLTIQKAYSKFGKNQRITELEIQLLKTLNKPYDHLKVYTVKNYYDFPITQNNYIKLANITEANFIKLVVMQYPLRSNTEFKTLLKEYSHISFIENNDNFKQQLLNRKYEDLFIDRFGEDFGHFNLFSSNIIVDQIINHFKNEKILENN